MTLLTGEFELVYRILKFSGQYSCYQFNHPMKPTLRERIMTNQEASQVLKTKGLLEERIAKLLAFSQICKIDFVIVSIANHFGVMYPTEREGHLAVYIILIIIVSPITIVHQCFVFCGPQSSHLCLTLNEKNYVHCEVSSFQQVSNPKMVSNGKNYKINFAHIGLWSTEHKTLMNVF